jgi:hypothetical protein
MRQTACDIKNDFSGKVQMFWGIGKPVVKGVKVWFSFTKLQKYFLEEGEGWIYYSDNILTEKDVSEIQWQLLPNGDNGIKNPNFGSVQEEFNIQPMNVTNGLYCIYRTTLGQPAHSYSYDNGKTWSMPELISYAGGLPLRNPRACARLWKCKNGMYLLWYHNNGGKDFKNRNPAWISGGIEKNGKIYWSQPEILIYGPDRSYETGRFSYPDLVEEDGKYWVTTTQKTTASIHKVPAEFFEMLWGQFDESRNILEGLNGQYYAFLNNKKIEVSEPLIMNNGGFALDFWIRIDEFKNNTIFEGKDYNSKSIELNVTDNGIVEFIMTTGVDTMKLYSDSNRFEKGKYHHIAILIDADAKISYMLVDGSICDGGGTENFGFSRFNIAMMEIELAILSIKNFSGEIDKLRLYSQRMFTSQFVNKYNAEKTEMMQ